MSQLFALLCLFISVHSLAEIKQSSHLFDVSFFVSDRVTEPDQSSIELAFDKVIMRLAADSAVPALFASTLKSIDAKRYMHSSSLEPTYEVQEDEKGNSFLAQRLTISFLPKEMNVLLDNYRIPRAAMLRPSLNIFLVGRDGAGLLTLSEEINRQSQLIAWPVEVTIKDGPLLDYLYEQKEWERLVGRLSLKDKQGRYDVVARLSDDKALEWRAFDNEFSVNVPFKKQLIDGFDDNQFRVRTLLDEVIKATGLTSFDRYSSNEKKDSQAHTIKHYKIKVTDVKNLSDYAAVMEYLSSLPPLLRLNHDSMEGDVMLVSIEAYLSKELLAELLGLERRLMLVSDLDQDVMEWRWFGLGRKD